MSSHPPQIPSYEDGDLALFKTGAIVLHIAAHHAGLLPDDANARAIAWMFAALNTVEPPILELANARLLEADKPWAGERLPARVRRAVGRFHGKERSLIVGRTDHDDLPARTRRACGTLAPPVG